MKKIFLVLAFVMGVACCFIGQHFLQKTLPQGSAVEQDSFKDYFEHVKKASDWLKAKTGNAQVTLMIVLSGGVDGPEQLLTNKQEVMSSDIPYFPKARVQGHEGKLIFGKLDGKGVVVLKGRFHYYEGLSPQNVVFPYFVLQQMGVKSLIATNAAGGIRADLAVGQIVMITDHINFFGQSSLRGLAIQRTHDQFPDMTNAYDRGYQELAKQVAQEQKMELKQGVYLAAVGPSYETKAEIKAFGLWGADVVGMSTVFEVIACNFLGIKVLTFSAVSNLTADRHESAMSHDEVLASMRAMAPKLSQLINGCARKIIALS